MAISKTVFFCGSRMIDTDQAREIILAGIDNDMTVEEVCSWLSLPLQFIAVEDIIPPARGPYAALLDDDGQEEWEIELEEMNEMERDYCDRYGL